MVSRSRPLIFPSPGELFVTIFIFFHALSLLLSPVRVLIFFAGGRCVGDVVAGMLIRRCALKSDCFSVGWARRECQDREKVVMDKVRGDGLCRDGGGIDGSLLIELEVYLCRWFSGMLTKIYATVFCSERRFLSCALKVGKYTII